MKTAPAFHPEVAAMLAAGELPESYARGSAASGPRRAQASAGASDGGAWLDDDPADAVACDAAMTPVVTGDVDPGALEDLVRLCVQLDRLRRHHAAGRQGAGRDTADSDGGGQSTRDTAGDTPTAEGTGSDTTQAASAGGTARAREALERAIIGKTTILLLHSQRMLELRRLR